MENWYVYFFIGDKFAKDIYVYSFFFPQMVHLNTLPDISFNRHSAMMLNTLLSPNFATNFTLYGTSNKFSFLATRIGCLLVGKLQRNNSKNICVIFVSYFVECLTTKYPRISKECIIKRIGKLLAGIINRKARIQRKGAVVSGRRDMSLITPCPQRSTKSNVAETRDYSFDEGSEDENIPGCSRRRTSNIEDIYISEFSTSFE